MIIYNRRKRNAFYAEQRIYLKHRLAEAIEAAAKGTADEDQMLLLNRERAADEADAARKARKGVWGSFKALFSTEGMKQEETQGGLDVLGEEGLRKMGAEAEASGAAETAQPIKSQGVEVAQGTILAAVEEKRREGEKELEKKSLQGGPLDQIAEQAADATKAKGGWTSWITSR